MPGESEGTQLPDSSLVVLLLSPVARFWATTSALTMTAPVASRTVPTMREVVWVSPGLKCCASGRVLALHLGDGGRVSHRGYDSSDSHCPFFQTRKSRLAA